MRSRVTVQRDRAPSLVGERFGRLVARECVESSGPPSEHRYRCDCDCGASTTVVARSLTTGHTSSCGCLHTKHGAAPRGRVTRTYRSWQLMIARCYRPEAERYPLYGGRGITVCDRWRGEHGFEHFLADMGERPAGLTLDRKDTDGNYEPENCQWADATVQARNRRTTKLTIETAREILRRLNSGETAAAIARSLGVGRTAVRDVRSGRTWREARGGWHR